VKTTIPISTIAYNSPEFLKFSLDQLVDGKKLAFWAFIPHKPEDDEAGDKIHSHLYAEPAVSIQTEDLRAFLREIDPNHELPLGCMPFCKSKFGDWYLYSIHDPVYLASKGESRRFQYSSTDIVTSDRDYLRFLIRKIDRTALTPLASMTSAIVSGLSFAEYFAQGLISPREIYTAEKCWNILSQTHWSTDRNGRPNHEDVVDVVNFDPDSTNEPSFRLENNGVLNVVDTETGEVLHSYEKKPKNG
jgi:hypothetical protein